MVHKRELVLNADQLRKWQGKKPKAGKKNDIYIVLDNVLDTYNIGSIFRLADAVSAKKIYLCGGSETPPNSRIKKASINTTEWVEWQYCESALKALKSIKKELKNAQIIAVEQTATAVHFNTFEYKFPVVLVVGHESKGISQEILKSKLLDGVVELPMFGVNKSLNVMVSLGIVLYKVLEKTS